VNDERPRRESGVTRVRGTFTLTVGFLALLASAVWIYWTVDGAVSYQRDVRLAQRARNDVFRAQLDEEVGLRGFAITRDIRFLRPYATARDAMAGDLATLETRLRVLNMTMLVRYVDDEAAIHTQWHDRIAAPIMAGPPSIDAQLLEQRDPALIKRFRGDDRQLDDGIIGAASDADFAVNIALARIVTVTGLLGLGFTCLYFYFSDQRARMSAETARTRALYENEKRIADALQAAFVQKALPVIPNMGFHASYIPAGAQARVGGDWYDAFELPNGRILFSIGDVAGHGIEAAVLMSRARQAIISSALHVDDPGEVLRRANETLMLQDPTMVTAVCGYIDPQTREICYATAGHPPPVLAAPDTDARFLEHDGMPLGIFADVPYGSFTTKAHAGTLLVLYTDGVIEHKRDLIEGERRLLEAARNVASRASADPARSLRDAIFGEAAPDDDVAIMTISFAENEFENTATFHAFSPNRLTVVAADSPKTR